MATFIALHTFEAKAQKPSMTIAHSGLRPNDTLWVMPGESIDFIYGGGGNHPMTSGQGSTASPVFFPTITVTSTTPLATFKLDTVGTYIFHCGTNPGNTKNWGTIIVMSSTGINETNADQNLVNIYPNPADKELVLQLQKNETGNYIISDVSGKIIASGKVTAKEYKVDISNFPPGNYVLKFELSTGIVTKSFIKN